MKVSTNKPCSIVIGNIQNLLLIALHQQATNVAFSSFLAKLKMRTTLSEGHITPKSGAPQASPEFSCYIFISRKADFKSKTVFSAPNSSYIDKLDSKHSRAALTLPSSRFTAPILYLASPTPSL